MEKVGLVLLLPERLSFLSLSEDIVLSSSSCHSCPMSYYRSDSLTWDSNNPIQNQGKRSIQPQSNQALSLPPSQLSIGPGITIPPSYSNPYQHSPYSTNASPFAFPSHSGLSHQNPFGQHSLPQNTNPHIPQSPSLHNPRKRSITELDSASTLSSNYPIDHHGLFSPTDSAKGIHANSYGLAGPSSVPGQPGTEGLSHADPGATPKPKKGRTNTPWTPAEEHRLKVMRDAGNSWSEIAKTFPTRTEGSVKKHWYKVRTTHCHASCYGVGNLNRIGLIAHLFTGHALRRVCGRRGQPFRSPLHTVVYSTRN